MYFTYFKIWYFQLKFYEIFKCLESLLFLTYYLILNKFPKWENNQVVVL